MGMSFAHTPDLATILSSVCFKGIELFTQATTLLAMLQWLSNCHIIDTHYSINSDTTVHFCDFRHTPWFILLFIGGSRVSTGQQCLIKNNVFI